MTIDHVPTLVSETFEGIFGPLTHIGTCVGLDRLLGSKTPILNKFYNGPNVYSFQRTLFPDQNGAKFLKIGQKLAEIWPSEVLYLKEVWPFPHGKFIIKWPKLE